MEFLLLRYSTAASCVPICSHRAGNRGAAGAGTLSAPAGARRGAGLAARTAHRALHARALREAGLRAPPRSGPAGDDGRTPVHAGDAAAGPAVVVVGDEPAVVAAA